MNTDPTPLAPLGPTDCYAYANGVIAWYEPGFVSVLARISDPGLAQDPPIRIPRHQYPVIVAVCEAYGLSHDDAALLAEAAERYAR